MSGNSVHFTPLKDFYSEELQSAYCVGLAYTADPGNPMLWTLLREWVHQGKVRLGSPHVPDMMKAEVSGRGAIE